MANKMKAQGTAFETAIVNYLNEDSEGPLPARRLPPHGPVDKGDIQLDAPFVCGVTLQAKDCKAFNFAGWVDDANAQSDAANTTFGLVVAKRRRKNIKDAYVVMDLETFRNLMRSLL